MANESSATHKHSIPKFQRKLRMSRMIAVQIFYQYNFLTKLGIDCDLMIIRNQLVSHYLLHEDDEPQDFSNEIDSRILDKLLAKLPSEQNFLDTEVLSTLKKDWGQLPTLAPEILRLGAFELKFSNVSHRIIIDEYTSIASDFFDDKKTALINGILQSLANKFRSKPEDQKTHD